MTASNSAARPPAARHRFIRIAQRLSTGVRPWTRFVRAATDRPRRGSPPPPGFRTWAGRHRIGLIAYALPLACVALAASTWFDGGFIASGDISPYVRDSLSREFGALWNHQDSGAGSTSGTITRTYDVLLIKATGVFGLPAAFAQYLQLGLCWGYAAFGAAYLARSWRVRPAAAAFAGLAGAFNPFLMTAHPNPLPAVAIGATGVLCGMIARRVRGKPVPAWGFALATLPLCYLAANPPLVFVTTVATAAFAAGVGALFGARWYSGLLLPLRSLPWTVLLNLWWMVPFGLSVFRAEGVEMTAQVDPGGWTWTHVRATLANVAVLNPHWGWDYIEYYPYRDAYEPGIWSLLAWCLPLLALAGAVLCGPGRRRSALTLAAVAMVLIAFGTASNPPFGPVNMWLLEHVPGFWLLREPAAKVNVVLACVYAVLGAFALDRALASARKPRAARLTKAALAGALSLGLLALAFPWPLWTGAVTDDRTAIDVKARVDVPDGWYEAAAAVNADPAPGKALVLPLNGYYQVTTDWAFHGVDDLPRQLITRPVLALMPGGYYDATGGVGDLLSGVQRAVLAGEEETARRLMQSLGVSHIVARHDLVDGTTQSPMELQEDLARQLEGFDSLDLTGRFGDADVYRVDDTGPIRLYEATAAPLGQTSAVDFLPELASHEAVASPGELTRRFAWQPGLDSRQVEFTVDREEDYLVERSRLAPFEVLPRADDGELVFADPVQYAMDGRRFEPSPSFRMDIDGEVDALSIGGRLEAWSGGPVLFGQREEEVTALGRGDDVLSAFGDLEDCEQFAADADLDAEIDDGTVSLSADRNAACVNAPAEVQGGRAYLLEFEYRSLSGRLPRVCLWELEAGRCASLPALTADAEWTAYRAAVRVGEDTDDARLFLYADGASGKATRAKYRDVSMTELEEVGSSDVELPAAEPIRVSVGAGTHQLEADHLVVAATEVRFGPVQSCATGDDPQDRSEVNGNGARLATVAQTACSWAQLRHFPGVAQRLELDYRNIAGAKARVCVWQSGPNRCVSLPETKPGPGEHRFVADFVPEPETEDLRLYVYADREEGALTEVEYAEARVYPVTTPMLTLTRAEEPAEGGPQARVAAVGSDQFRAEVTGMDGRGVVLALAESFATGWRLENLPEGWTAEHIELDGYANAWLLKGTGDAHLTLEYGASVGMRAVYSISLAAGLALVIGFAAKASRDRGSRQQSHVRRKHRESEAL